MAAWLGACSDIAQTLLAVLLLLILLTLPLCLLLVPTLTLHLVMRFVLVVLVLLLLLLLLYMLMMLRMLLLHLVMLRLVMLRLVMLCPKRPCRSPSQAHCACSWATASGTALHAHTGMRCSWTQQHQRQHQGRQGSTAGVPQPS